MMANINTMAKIVDDAARAGKAIPQLSNKYDYTLEEAYNVQAASFQRRLARGENILRLGLCKSDSCLHGPSKTRPWQRLIV